VWFRTTPLAGTRLDGYFEIIAQTGVRLSPTARSQLMRLGIKCSRIARTAAEPCEKTIEMAKLGSDRLV